MDSTCTREVPLQQERRLCGYKGDLTSVRPSLLSDAFRLLGRCCPHALARASQPLLEKSHRFPSVTAAWPSLTKQGMDCADVSTWGWRRLVRTGVEVRPGQQHLCPRHINARALPPMAREVARKVLRYRQVFRIYGRHASVRLLRQHGLSECLFPVRRWRAPIGFKPGGVRSLRQCWPGHAGQGTGREGRAWGQGHRTLEGTRRRRCCHAMWQVFLCRPWGELA